MEFALLAVTLVSLGIAAAMSAIAWRLRRAERRRSAARVEALSELAARDEGDPLDRPLRRTRSVLAPTVSADPRTGLNGAGGDLFAVREVRDGRRRDLVFAAAFVVVAGAVAVLLAFSQPRTKREPASGGRTAPLELLSLRHVKQDETLTISGLVLNPADGRELRGIVAVAFVFDQAGEFTGSGRAALEFSRLAPGAESAFRITIASASGVGRYRIGFRTDDGGVLGHIDRRTRAVTTPAEPASTPARTSLATAPDNPR